jgi:hypothetical protein
MQNAGDTIHTVQVLKDWDPIPSDSLTTWIEVAERHGFEAVLPLIEKEGIDVVNRTLLHGATDWLFLAGVESWNTALLIGSDLGAAIESLITSFHRLVIVEPNGLMRRLLEIRFKPEIARGRIYVKTDRLNQSDVDFDLLWFVPTIGRSRGCLPLTAELKALLQACTKRLAPGGVLAAKVIRDRGLFGNLPLPAIGYEPGRGYSLKEFEQIFPIKQATRDGQLQWYWLTARHNGRTSGTTLQSQAAISFCIRRRSRWFRLMGPLAEPAVRFVTRRVSSLMLVFKHTVTLSSAAALVHSGTRTHRHHGTLQRILAAVREQYQDSRQLVPVLYRSGTLRRDARAIYLLLDSERGQPLYVVRISKGRESELRLRNESTLYHALRERNGALKSLDPVHYVISGNTSDLSAGDAYPKGCDGSGNSFSIERFFDGITGATFARQPFLDSVSLDWLKRFQRDSEAVAEGVFDNHALCNELYALKDYILKGTYESIASSMGTRHLRARIPRDILKPLFADVECRLKEIQPFRLPLTAVHGDFCPMNLRAYYRDKNAVPPRVLDKERRACTVTECQRTPRLHVFDWEYLAIGGPLLDPWLYVISIYLSVQRLPQSNIIPQFVKRKWKLSKRLEQCLTYYARISEMPVDLLTGYLPIALFTVYARETARSAGTPSLVRLIEETIISYTLNRRNLWRYIDALTKAVEKEIHK